MNPKASELAAHRQPTTPAGQRQAARPCLEQAGRLRQMGRLVESIAPLQQAIRLDPGNAWYHFYLGGVLSDSGNKQAARAELEMARKLDPDNATFRPKD